MFETLTDVLNKSKIPYSLNEAMAPYTTFKIGGAADVFVTPESMEQLKLVLKCSRENNIPFFILGNGSDLLVSDNGIEGVVIYLKNFDSISMPSAVEIICGAGTKLSMLCSYAYRNSLSGLEFAWGIPGTVGGAVYMNAGAYNSEIVNVLTECTYINESGQLVTADVSALNMGYRKSIFTNTENVIISAKFKLKSENKDIIKSTMDELIERRKSKQPLEYPSAGSTFKRPQGYYAAALIEECGLKGETVGGAMVSEKHSGFIINVNNATSSDVLMLIEKVKNEVFLQKSVNLEPEVKFVGR